MEAHRTMVDGLEVWRQQDAILLAMTNAVDYDQEAYAQLLEEMVREKQEVLADLALKARAFRYVEKSKKGLDCIDGRFYVLTQGMSSRRGG